jgi:L-threonylcarbamoyladenylate synthase
VTTVRLCEQYVRENVHVLPDNRHAVPADDLGISAAVEVLASGGLVGLPTETVYGLAADAHNIHAVARIFQVKGRPANHPLIVHLTDAAAIDDWAVQIPAYARTLATQLWPGPLTLILPKRAEVSDVLTGNQESIGLRVPAHPVALEVIARSGGALAAPSANRFGRVSPTSAQAVASELAEFLDDRDLILDGGGCSVGIESTIVDCSGENPQILRPGFYGDDVIAETCAMELFATGAEPKIRVSGSLAAHYAPRTPVHLVSEADLAHLPPEVIRNSAVIAPDGVSISVQPAMLTSVANSLDYAQILYASLRDADAAQVAQIYAVLPEPIGIGIAIRDRLHRAAAGSQSHT